MFGVICYGLIECFMVGIGVEIIEWCFVNDWCVIWSYRFKFGLEFSMSEIIVLRENIMNDYFNCCFVSCGKCRVKFS